MLCNGALRLIEHDAVRQENGVTHVLGRRM